MHAISNQSCSALVSFLDMKGSQESQDIEINHQHKRQTENKQRGGKCKQCDRKLLKKTAVNIIRDKRGYFIHKAKVGQQTIIQKEIALRNENI